MLHIYIYIYCKISVYSRSEEGNVKETVGGSRKGNQLYQKTWF